MRSPQEISKQTEAFWTAFGKYMRPILSAEELPISWINYKTNIQGVNFKMEADDKNASIAIVFSHADLSRQQVFYNRLVQMKQILEETLGEYDWAWQQNVPDKNGKIVSSLSKQLKDVSIYQQEHWPAIISFLKPRIIALDAFWSMGKYGFEEL